ncbi:NADP-dependent phosphogluconate dehydrogenase [Halobacillus salinarum]|uniref:6-phosphogluconate dehydrogenase, decarboxylating n=1 Tax=Halobacillus salinarum TaxID=2932257 RepID=A0ABY4EEG9_9BACI|nr:NADP-dependent phosphogluconate dehydrogenase [Halobacillus salinarum]UOQ42855.1 NADP-dependent phosphogluconate dehydrogenase [Halobacillus salinarum]
MPKENNVGVVGLTVMGKNLALNIEKRGYFVSVFNRTYQRTKDFLENEGQGKNFQGNEQIESFVASLAKPRVILLMVKAGQPTDATIDALLPHLEQGDILIDGGNTFYKDTIERNEKMNALGVHFIGTGISGGEEGALNGPSIMAGGSAEAYRHVEPLLTAISAKVDDEPCAAHTGPDGSGHYVKMVHNGIEYSDMQLISEIYFIMKNILKLSGSELHDVFAEWNKGELDSYLIEITADIFTKEDKEVPGTLLVDNILDTAAQKGTGKWSSQSALDLGVPQTMITESVYARFISALKNQRIKASKVLNGPEQPENAFDREELLESLRQALYFSKICSYAQGFAQMSAASEEYNWNLDYGNIAMIFRGGCIIRAQFLQKIKEAYDTDNNLDNLLLDPYFNKIANEYHPALRKVVSLAISHGIAVPTLSSALAYYDSYRSERLPANLLQAQRDYFGAHTYQRLDKEGSFHTEWQEK